MLRTWSRSTSLILTLTLIPATFTVAGARAQTSGDAAATAPRAGAPAKSDTTTGKKPGRVKISIDESGISVEGDARSVARDTTGESEWVVIRDDRGPMKEKGVDIVKFGKSVFVASDEMVRGDLVVFGGNAIIEGRVTGNVFVIGGNIRARSGAEIKGDAMVIGGVLDEDDDVIIHGERILFDDLMPNLGLGLFSQSPWLRWAVLPVWFFIKLVLAFLVLLFLRDRITVGDEHLASNPLKSFGAGILTAVVGLFALLIVMIPLVITVIGIPLALLLVVSCAGVFIIAWTVFAFALGRVIAARMGSASQSAFLFVFIGAVVLFLPDIISAFLRLAPGTPMAPLGLAFKALGMLVGLFAYMTGLGAIVLSRFGGRALAAPLVAPAAPAPPPPGA